VQIRRVGAWAVRAKCVSSANQALIVRWNGTASRLVKRLRRLLSAYNART